MQFYKNKQKVNKTHKTTTATTTKTKQNNCGYLYIKTIIFCREYPLNDLI
jgi:hypothetical protein